MCVMCQFFVYNDLMKLFCLHRVIRVDIEWHSADAVNPNSSVRCTIWQLTYVLHNHTEREAFALAMWILTCELWNGWKCYKMWYGRTVQSAFCVPSGGRIFTARCYTQRGPCGLSVCLSVKRRYSVQTAKQLSSNILSSGSHSILVFPHQTV